MKELLDNLRSKTPEVPSKAPSRAPVSAPVIRAKQSIHTSARAFPIVGVGASAGGLEAFTAFLTALPPATGMAFVLVQHLDARNESMLSDLLSKATPMPVTEVRQEERVAPNQVYVIPPNADLELANGVLRILDREAGPHLPIDHFFQTLAETWGPQSIGVVLSGTASDGTMGLQAIKVAGGITFAQEPRSAKFDGMPQSAILSGCVDFVLSPERIARKLSHVVPRSLSRLSNPETGNQPVAGANEDWTKILELLTDECGVDFASYKISMISRRVARRLTMAKVKGLSAYRKYLQDNREEVGALSQDLLIHVTSFFREPDVFRALQSRIVPQILASKPLGEPLRIWVPGCASGEEAYSIAISLLEKLGDRADSTSIQIFASDVSRQAVDKARRGIYAQGALKKVSKERVQRFFTRVNGSYQVKSEIRDLCIFARHDLARDPPFPKLDLISCRNVLIYLQAVPQRKILASFHHALRDVGFLLLGKSETPARFPYFEITDRRNKFFAKAALTPPNRGEPLLFERPIHREKNDLEAPSSFDLEKEADRIVWERSRHAGLIVNSELEILHFRGDTSPYLRPFSGKATFQLLRVLREEILLEVRAAIHAARDTNSAAKKEAVRIKRDGDFRFVDIEVRSLPKRGEGVQFFLILFEEVIPPSGSPRSPGPARRRKSGPDQEVGAIQNELARTRDYLQAVIQEHETVNQKLRVANEEAQSNMEELHSANEELETAQEEIQATNEELVTLNDQLQNRNTELADRSDELSNVLSGADIPILILGGDRRIRRFTPPAEKLLHLLPGDVGRPLNHIRIGVNLPDLDKSITHVISGAGTIWREVQAENGRWYSVRILPFLTAERKIDGVLMAFVDVDDLRQSREKSQREEKLITAIMNAAKDLLVIVLDREGFITQFNLSAQELTGYSLDEVKGRCFWDVLPIPEERAHVKSDFEVVLSGGTSHGETHWRTKQGHPRLIAWSNTVAVSEAGAVDYVIRTGVDVTRREEAQEQARESDAAVRTLLETVPAAVLAHGPDGRIKLVNGEALTLFGYRREEMIGQPLANLIPQRFRKLHAAHEQRFFRKPCMRPMGAALNLFALRKDGSEFPVDVGLSFFETRAGVLGVVFVSDITERKQSEAMLLQNKQELQALTARLLGIQEAGNKNLSRELHDGLSQKLAALGMEVSTLFQPSSKELDLLPDRVRALSARINNLAGDVQAMSRRLHPAILTELGLEAAIRQECVGFSAQEGVTAQFKSARIPPSLPVDVSLCLYRVVQESLRNIAKHAKATSVKVTLSGRNDAITLRVQDTGEGFHLSEVKGKGGLGLISMEERVRLVNGNYSIQSNPGKGTTVEFFVPLGTKGK